MAPITPTNDLVNEVNDYINKNKVVIFSKTTCPYCSKVKQLFKDLNVTPVVIELDEDPQGQELHEALKIVSQRKTVPQVYVGGQHVGGCDDTIKAKDTGVLSKLLNPHSFDYDLIIIGGGSGGLAASKEAAKYGRKVAVLDFVKPTPIGTTWGLGGTCVNVGCIPKKLMHTAALIGERIHDSTFYGWKTPEGEIELHKNIVHDWTKMRDEVQMYIKSLNFGYRTSLRKNNVEYINAYGSLIDRNQIQLSYKNNTTKVVTADKFIIATGERPKYPDIPGADLGITSDDLFSLNYPPGKTLVVGASYVALECAGFLKAVGFEVEVWVRSILLRGFDQEIAEKIYEHMLHEGISFQRPMVPDSVEQIEPGTPGKLRVHGTDPVTGAKVSIDCNTVLWAIGRDPCTSGIGLENAGVKLGKNGFIPVVNEQTNVDNIYAIGDIGEGLPELTPVAIEAGVLLARRLYANSDVQCDYINVPTTVFTPLEYGCCGYSEEDAIAKFGVDNLEIYIQHFTPLEWSLPHRPVNKCYAKLICLRNENERCIGFHYLGPNAGEVTQLSGILLKKNCTKADFDALIGIHPTCAEIFTTMSVTKRSGKSAEQQGC